MVPNSVKRPAAARQRDATSGSTGVMPRSAEKATRAGRHPDHAAARKLSVLGHEIGSARLSPVMASRSKAVSSTVRPMGPFTPRSRSILAPGLLATRPGLGRRPTTPQKLAGLRKLPARSDPCATQAVPVARATAAPPNDPAADNAVFHGLRVAPNTSLKVLPPAPNSGVFDLA